MTKNTETKQPVELNDDEMENVQGGGWTTGPLGKSGKQGIATSTDLDLSVLDAAHP